MGVKKSIIAYRIYTLYNTSSYRLDRDGYYYDCLSDINAYISVGTNQMTQPGLKSQKLSIPKIINCFQRLAVEVDPSDLQIRSTFYSCWVRLDNSNS